MQPSAECAGAAGKKLAAMAKTAVLEVRRMARDMGMGYSWEAAIEAVAKSMNRFWAALPGHAALLRPRALALREMTAWRRDAPGSRWRGA
jgi:hypothetical protein